MWWKKILTGWPKLWLVLCLLPGMCLKTQAETLCFSGDVPVPEGVAPEVALQPEFLGAYLMYRGGEVNLGDSVFSSFGDIPLKCETPAPNKYATCEHFGASSASGAIYQPPDPYTYSIVFREIKAVGTLCQADGTCTTHEYLSAHAGCVSSTYTPYTLALSGSSHTVDKDLTPIDLTAQVLIGGHPIIDRKVDVQMSDLGANGYLRCGMGCNGWRTDNDGRMRLQYVPGKRSAEPITFTATCPGCGNAAKWKVTSQRALLIGFFNGVANSRDAAQMSLDRLKREFGPMHHETKWAAAGSVDTDLSFLSSLELYGTEIAERRMPTRRVVEALDVIEHV